MEGKEPHHPHTTRLRSFRELAVWQRSIELALAVYDCTQSFPREETYGLAAQMRRAAVSVPSNIAEGYGRNNRKEYRHFLGIARGSNNELQTQIVLAGRLSYSPEPALTKAQNFAEEVDRMLLSMLRRLAADLTNPTIVP